MGIYKGQTCNRQKYVDLVVERLQCFFVVGSGSWLVGLGVIFCISVNTGTICYI